MARVSDFQKSQLIDFIEENYEYLFGKHPSMMGAHSKQAKWAEITAILNGLGPAIRTAAQWKKTWSDIKSKVKEKSCLIRQSFNTGNNQLLTLDEFEKRIEKICGQSAIHGDKELDELGFGEPKLLKDHKPT